MKRSLLLLIACLLIISATNRANAKDHIIRSEEQLSFAQKYMDQGEFEKAIVELERFMFFFPDDENVPFAQYLTGECYSKLNKNSRARKVLDELYRKDPDGDYTEKALFLIGESFYKEGMYEEAEICFTGLLKEHPSSDIRDEAVYRLGWSQLSAEKWNEASDTFKSMDKNSLLYAPSLNISEEINNGQGYKEKNPLTAGVMAGIVPGLGHIYCGRYRDGLTAFVLNGLFIWAAVDSFNNDHEALGSILTFIEAGWYAGNIYSAVNCAHKFNRKSKNDFLIRLNKNTGVNPSFFGRKNFGLSFNMNFK